MEPRNYEAGAAGAPPAVPAVPSAGYPTGGDPQTGTPATKPGAHWFYKVGESLRKIITDAGLTPDDADLTQLKTAMVSPQADVDAGADDNRFVTPKKLRWGFSSLLAGNGYIVFPTWLGGLIFQWGSNTFTSAPFTINAVTLPIVFPNAPLANIAGGQANGDNGQSTTGSTSISSSQIGIWSASSSGSVSARWIAIGY